MYVGVFNSARLSQLTVLKVELKKLHSYRGVKHYSVNIGKRVTDVWKSKTENKRCVQSFSSHFTMRGMKEIFKTKKNMLKIHIAKSYVSEDVL